MIGSTSHFFFFFQAEDGIRDYKVTGVQTCALPIYSGRGRRTAGGRIGMSTSASRPLYAYVGSRTTRERDARGEGITVYRVDEATGGLQHLQTVDGLSNPSFLALDAAGTRLYTRSEER